jgi:hypothetical protein
MLIIDDNNAADYIRAQIDELGTTAQHRLKTCWPSTARYLGDAGFGAEDARQVLAEIAYIKANPTVAES